MSIAHARKIGDKSIASATLLRLEDVIETAEGWAAEAAKALVQIRNDRLYRGVYKTFDAYVRGRWGWERSRAYQMCQFGEVLTRLSTKVDKLPTRESHVRPLYPLDEADQVWVWRRVLAEYGTTPTASDVQRIVAQFHAPLSRSFTGVMPYCGSKASLIPQILRWIPKHDLYVETHAGSAVMLLSKVVSRIEVLNDRDDALVCFFRVLREARDELVEGLRRTPFALTEWQQCRDRLGDPGISDVEKARRFYVLVCQSFAGFGEKFNRSTHKPHAVYWKNRIERLDEVAERLRGVVIENLDAVECIQKYDRPNAVFFVDPPYITSARSKLGPTYRVDMSIEDHEVLLDAVEHAKGRVLLAGGESGLYAERLKGWRVCYRQRVPCGSGGSKVGRYATPYRTEVLWSNV